MFKKNESYKQYNLFGVTDSLSEHQRSMLKTSIEHSFFINIFSKINEKDFDVLYSIKKSRPNVPVNQLVGALILKHLYNWTYQQLFMNLNFNILTRHALGVQNLGGSIFAEASIFNFQNKVIEYYVQTGHDLLTAVFDSLTTAQLKEFGIKTDIQRGDSFLLGSNIFDYTRLQLLIEVLLRFFKILDVQDKEKYLEMLSVYTRQTAGQYIYKLEKSELPKEIQQLADIYHTLYVQLEEKYQDVAVFSIFQRVYNEHFVVIENKVEVLSAKELNSGILFSPDDEEATYRYKRGVFSKGYNGHISETANPKNKFNLITDVTVTPNNEDDAKILENRLPYMIEKTPELSEYHADGKYGSPNLDVITKNNSIMLIQTAVRGRKSESKVILEKDEAGDFWVNCSQGQKVRGEITTYTEGARRGRAVFDNDRCKLCPYKNKCLARPVGGKRTGERRIWYFNETKILSHQRSHNIYKIPEERRKLRSNVEATIKELKRGVKNGKSRLRGLIRNSFYLTLTSISVNLTRIHKHGGINGLFDFFGKIMKELLTITVPILLVHDPLVIKKTPEPISN